MLYILHKIKYKKKKYIYTYIYVQIVKYIIQMTKVIKGYEFVKYFVTLK